jgi:hypothetical protein
LQRGHGDNIYGLVKIKNTASRGNIAYTLLRGNSEALLVFDITLLLYVTRAVGMHQY